MRTSDNPVISQNLRTAVTVVTKHRRCTPCSALKVALSFTQICRGTKRSFIQNGDTNVSVTHDVTTDDIQQFFHLIIILARVVFKNTVRPDQ